MSTTTKQRPRGRSLPLEAGPGITVLHRALGSQSLVGTLLAVSSNTVGRLIREAVLPNDLVDALENPRLWTAAPGEPPYRSPGCCLVIRFADQLGIGGRSICRSIPLLIGFSNSREGRRLGTAKIVSEASEIAQREPDAVALRLALDDLLRMVRTSRRIAFEPPRMAKPKTKVKPEPPNLEFLDDALTFAIDHLTGAALEDYLRTVYRPLLRQTVRAAGSKTTHLRSAMGRPVGTASNPELAGFITQVLQRSPRFEIHSCSSGYKVSEVGTDRFLSAEQIRELRREWEQALASGSEAEVRAWEDAVGIGGPQPVC